MSSYSFSDDAVQDLDDICKYNADRTPRLFVAAEERNHLFRMFFKQ